MPHWLEVVAAVVTEAYVIQIIFVLLFLLWVFSQFYDFPKIRINFRGKNC